MDLRYALRNLLKHPGFTAVAVITLALGMGANTAIFSVVNAVLLRPLPYQDADQLVMIWGNFLKLNIGRLPAKASEYRDYAQQSETFEDVAAFENQSFNLVGRDQPERVDGTRVTTNLFSLLRTTPVAGRGFAPDESRSGRDDVVVLSYGFWQRYFGGDWRAVNQTISLDGRTYTVIGVMPAGFQFPYSNFPSQRTEFWMPLVLDPEQVSERRGPYFLNVLGRLKSGVTLSKARAEMSALGQRFEQEQRGYRGPNGEDGGWRITVMPLQEEIVGASRRALWVMFGAVGLVLLIACANVANLLSVRAARRRKELSVRSALGASRARILKQLLVEGLLLTALGGGVGLLFAHWGVDLLAGLSPTNLPRSHEINIDGRGLALTALVSILTGILFSLLPGLQASKVDLQRALQNTVALVSNGRRRQRWSDLLVVTEVALALLLLIGAGLLGHSFLRLQRVNPVMATERLLSAEINLSAARYREPTQVSAFYQELASRVESLPGVQAATFSTLQPLSGAARNDPFAIEGRPLNPGNLTSAGWQLVGANYFHTLGIPLTKGRDLTLADINHGAPPVAVINEKMAAHYWPNESPLGRRITLGLPRPENPWITIVGIAKDLPHRALGSQPEPDWYLSRAPGVELNRYLIVRAAGDPVALAQAIRNEVWAIDRDQPLTAIKTMNDVIDETIAPQRFNTLLLAVFAVVALTLATLGIYGVLSYSVTLRTQEYGIRRALGAQDLAILSQVIKDGMTLAAIGTVIGLAAAFLLTRLMSSLLFEVSPTDPLTYILVSLCSLAVALLACYIPARRATKVEPLVALRYE